MKKLLAFLSLVIISAICTPVFANPSASTKIGIGVTIKGSTPCHFEFSAESNRAGISKRSNKRRVDYYVDSLDCATQSNELLEDATNVVKQATHVPGANRVRVTSTIE